MRSRITKLVLAVIFALAAAGMMAGAFACAEDSSVLLASIGALVSLTFCLAFALTLLETRPIRRSPKD